MVVSVAKGLEPASGKRMSEVYGEEIASADVVVVGGPCLARELAEGLPTAAICSENVSVAEESGKPFDDQRYQLSYTDDMIGVELCSMMKNVAAIGLGVLDGLGKSTGIGYQNVKAALFTRAAREIVTLVTALGGRSETAMGLAGIGDQLVTSLGGGTDSTASSWGPGIRRTTRSGSWKPEGSRWKASNPHATFGGSRRERHSTSRTHEAIHRCSSRVPGHTTSWRCSDDEPDPSRPQLTMELARVTEAAALAAGSWIGRGDKIGADQAAVDAMRFMIELGLDGRRGRDRRG